MDFSKYNLENQYKIEKDDKYKSKEVKMFLPPDKEYYQDPVDFQLNCTYLNTINLTSEQYYSRYDRGNPFDHVEFPVLRPTDLLYCTITLPPIDCIDGTPQLVVRDFETKKENVFLSNLYKNNWHYDKAKKTISLHIKEPLLGFKYDIVWHIPSHNLIYSEPRFKGQIEYITNKLFEAKKNSNHNKIINRLKTVSELVKEYLEIKKSEDLDISIMVVDTTEKPEKLIIVRTGNTRINDLIKIFDDNLTMLADAAGKYGLVELHKHQIVY